MPQTCHPRAGGDPGQPTRYILAAQLFPVARPRLILWVPACAGMTSLLVDCLVHNQVLPAAFSLKILTYQSF
jgi:hypothetical protein